MEHVTVNTRDLDGSIRFYQEYLGLSITGDMRGNGRPIVFMAGTGGGTKLELIENPDEPYSGSGLSIGFHFDDVDAARKVFEDAGFAPTPVISPAPGVRFFFVKDPNGLTIQII